MEWGEAEQSAGEFDTSHLPKVPSTTIHIQGKVENLSDKPVENFTFNLFLGQKWIIVEEWQDAVEMTVRVDLQPGETGEFSINRFLTQGHIPISNCKIEIAE
ncbi:MAG: hypothetical protein ACOX5R_15875 [bacterium]